MDSMDSFQAIMITKGCLEGWCSLFVSAYFLLAVRGSWKVAVGYRYEGRSNPSTDATQRSHSQICEKTKRVYEVWTEATGY